MTDEGFAQAADLASLIQHHNLEIRHIYSSDLLRAMQTAQPVADKLRLEVFPMPEFREVNNGALAGMKNERANERYPGLYWNTLGWEQPYPDGESPREFYERICLAWDSFQGKVLEQNENVLLVTHGGVIHVILSIVNGEDYSNKITPRKIKNTELIALEYGCGGWQESENLFDNSTQCQDFSTCF